MWDFVSRRLLADEVGPDRCSRRGRSRDGIPENLTEWEKRALRNKR